MNATLVAFRALVRKDVLAFLRDRRALVVNVLTPILIAAFFGYVFGGNGRGTELARLPVALVDEDRSAESAEIVRALAADASLETQTLAREGARALVRQGKLRAAVVLPAGFGLAARRALFGAGTKPDVELLYDPSQSFARPIVEGLLTLHVMQTVTRQLFSANGSTELVDGVLADLRESPTVEPGLRTDLEKMLGAVREFQARRPAPAAAGPGASGGGGLAVPFALRDVAVSAGPRYNGYAHSFAGMSVQFILFMGIDAGINVLLQRQQGVWRRLRAAPVSRGLLLLARTVSTTLIALLILGAIYLAARLVFNVRIEGSVAGFGLVAVGFAVFTAATGLLVAALGRSVAATRGLAAFLVLLLVMLGGAWVPTFIFPGWLQRASLFVPTRWAIDGFDGTTWRGLPFEAALGPAAVLLGSALLFSAVALWRFDWEAE